MSRFFLMSLTCLSLLTFGMVLAEEKELSPEDEAKIEAREDADPDAKMADGLKGIFKGTLVLDAPDKPSGRGVIGSLTVSSESKTYLARVADESLLEKLKPLDGKVISVTGKVRVNGKYLIILSLVPATGDSTPRDKRKRNGL